MKTYKPGDLLVNNENKCRYIVVTKDEWLRWASKEYRRFNRRFATSAPLVLVSLGEVGGFHGRFEYLVYDSHAIGENFFTKIEI